MSIVEDLLTEYAEKKTLYLQLEDDIEDIITSSLESNGIKVSNICFRLKTEKSLKKKIYYKNKYTQLNDITDILGCRILTLFESDINKIYNLLEQIFDIVEVSDKRKKSDTSKIEFGYNSLHIIATMSSKRCELIEYSKFKDIKFEIQLRTVLQHAWDEIEHGLGYKSTYEVPSNIRRNLNRLSSTLEILDEQFELIRNDVENYLLSINKVEKIMKTDINKNSLSNYVLQSHIINSINQELANTFNYTLIYDLAGMSQSKIVEKLNFLGYNYIHELDKDMENFKNDIIKVGKAWIKEFEIDEQMSINGFNVLMYFVLTIINQNSTDISGTENSIAMNNFINTFYIKNSNLTENIEKKDSKVS